MCDMRTWAVFPIPPFPLVAAVVVAPGELKIARFVVLSGRESLLIL